MSALRERYDPPLLSPRDPPGLINERVYDPECGCSVYLGVRIDTSPPEVISVATPCAPRHRERMVRFIDLMKWSLADGGSERPLADVVEEILTQSLG